MASPPNTKETSNTQASDAQRQARANWPIWLQYMPTARFTPAEPDITKPLIDPDRLEAMLNEVASKATTNDERTEYEAAKQRIYADIHFMKHELLRLQRQRDHEAKRSQNDYRLYQILFLILAALATALGSFQSLALAGGAAAVLALLAFGETAVALVSVYLATISGREPPLPRWLDSRRKAEQLRREYFRFLLNLAPYSELDDIDRRLMLSERAANINRGVFPDESGLI